MSSQVAYTEYPVSIASGQSNSSPTTNTGAITLNGRTLVRIRQKTNLNSYGTAVKLVIDIWDETGSGAWCRLLNQDGTIFAITLNAVAGACPGEYLISTVNDMSGKQMRIALTLADGITGVAQAAQKDFALCCITEL